MKKVFLWISFGVICIVACLYYQQLNNYPLEMHDFRKLFSGNIKRVDKIYSHDFVGLSFHGEIYDITIYKLIGNPLITDTPQILKWENENIDQSSIVKPWKKCPVDSQTKSLNSYIVTQNIKNEIIGEKYFQQMNNINNYYKYIENSDGDRYFFLYRSDRHILYYIRIEGA